MGTILDEQRYLPFGGVRDGVGTFSNFFIGLFKKIFHWSGFYGKKTKPYLWNDFLTNWHLGRIGCAFISSCRMLWNNVLYSNQSASPARESISTPPSIPATDTLTIPAHTINDYWDNGKGTNFAYFIVADEPISDAEAMAIIQKYQDKHRGYMLINI